MEMPTRPAVPSGGAPVQPPAGTPPVAPAVKSDEPPRNPETPADASTLPPVRPPVRYRFCHQMKCAPRGAQNESFKK